MLGTVGLVLLVACANVANLFLVRTEGRRREVAVRMTLGAGRGRMVRHFLTESMMLALVGGALGLALAFAGVEAVIRFGPESLPRLHELAISLPVLAFTLGVSIVAGVGFGMIPVLRYAVPNLLGALKGGSSRGAVAGRERYRGLLVVSQVALALMLLVGAGLMVRSFWNLRNVDPGFIADGVLTFRISLPETDYPDQETAARFQQQVNDRLEALPGVRSVGAITCLPLAGCRDVAHVMREGMDIAPDEVPPPAEVRGVTDGYFAAMGISLLSGRTIDRSDHERRTRRVVVSKTLAEHFWPGESAIGKRIYPGVERDPPWYTVAGVVSDVLTKSLMEEPTEILYLPMLGAYEAMHAPESLAFALKVGGPPEALATVVREEIWAMDPNLPLASVQTMRSLVSDAEAPMAFTMVQLGIAAVVALILGAIGVYGVLSYIVTQRRGEIGVRMALGATAGHVNRMILRLGAGVAAIGVVLGLGGALALTRLMQALLFNVRPTDFLTYSVVSVTLFVVALVASYLPARRAGR